MENTIVPGIMSFNLRLGQVMIRKKIKANSVYNVNDSNELMMVGKDGKRILIIVLVDTVRIINMMKANGANKE